MKKTRIMTAAAALVLLMGVASMAAFAADDGKSSSAPAATVSQSDGSAVKEKERTRKKGGVRVDVLKVAASVLGKTEAEVKEAVKTGKVGDLLVAAGKVEDFKSAYLTELKAKLDAAVTAGTLTQEQADQSYASGKTKMDAYDGTTHLCGGKDHSKMFEKKSKSKSGDGSAASAETA